jgi:hypothetical protein
MTDFGSRPKARLSLEQLRKQAKELLRQYRAGDERARVRFGARGTDPALADAQCVVAREAGFETWASLKHHVEEQEHARLEPYHRFARDLLIFESDAEGLGRIHEILGRSPDAALLREQVLHRIGASADHVLHLEDARLYVAKFYGFGGWSEMEASVARSRARRSEPVHGVSGAPPFYRIRWKERSIEPRPPLSGADWEEIFEVMRDRQIEGLHAGGQLTDATLERLAALDLVTSLDLDGSARVTDAGLKHLAKMPRLERLNLSGCDITDEGLSVLGSLPALRDFSLYHHQGISDAGLAHLAACERLERVVLLGSNSGDGAIRALAGKPALRQLLSGNQVTDAGLPLLHQFPAFKTGTAANPELSLMAFREEPNHLLLRGQITDRGMASLAGLDGLFSLNLDDSKLALTAEGLRPLAALPNLCCLGFDADDETMGAIAALPRLRKLMCQDTRATDTGFETLSRCGKLEYLWGRRCYGLTGVGLAALSRLPKLRGMNVSCRNVEDGALSRLPDYPALVELVPMDVRDDGFRHIGRCEGLRALWCMGCRDTGDAATAHLAGLRNLQTYYAGGTQITDRSLEILVRITSLERLVFSACGGVTNGGIAMLAALPQLRELSLEYMPGVTREVMNAIPGGVQVNFET